MAFRIPSAYQLVKEEELNDINGKGLLLTHKKTGARIALVANDDINKVFYIGFRTPPADSTGVAHIIEHSVLCGSKSFPAKDPFVELVKGSLNTFLNAMTYADRTVYPVASQNDQDFKNLMHVYMDAVLHPNIYSRKEIFMQEGWHYDIEDENDEIKLNGVVYNEMKGAFSSPESQLFRLNQNSLFPDTPYGVESGGDPDFIPELSYEQFLDFHKCYYHPSNSYIYLYGDMDFEERLAWLDEAYLSQFDRLNVDSVVPVQQGFGSVREVKDYYSLTEGDSIDENTYLSYNAAIGTSSSSKLNLSMAILDYVLVDSPGAPIKQALLDAGVGRDIMSSYSNEYLQPMYSIVAKNTYEDKKEEFIRIIRDTLSGLASEGLGERSLRAAINFYEFKYREADYGPFPKGLIYGLRVMSSWLYEDDEPFRNLKDNEIFAFLKEQVGTGYYEKLITDYLLNNTHASLVVLSPSPGLNAQREERIRQRLEEYRAGLGSRELKQIIDETRQLKEYQETPSSKEELEAIPMLTREDIGEEPQPMYNKETVVSGIKVLHHDVFTNGIAYIKLLFDVSDIPTGMLPYMSLLSLILGLINTENYSYLELSNEINLNTGGVSTDVKSFSRIRRPDEYLPVFEIGAKVMYDKLPDAFRIMEEIIHKSVFDDAKRLKELIDELKSRMQMRFNASGHSVASDRAISYYSVHGLFKERTAGIDFYKFLEELADNYDSRKNEVIGKLKTLMQMIFTRDKLIASVTADPAGYDLFAGSFSGFVQGLLKEADKSLFTPYGKDPLVPECLNEGFKAAMQVQYVARAGNFLKAGYRYTGALKVLKTILSYDYLWNQVRVKGGAYGCFCSFSGVDGDAYFVSYRDPNLAETNMVYEKAVDFVKNYTADERDITKSIIGTISTLDTPMTPQTKGNRSLVMYLSGVTYEELKKERDEIRNVTQEDIRELAGLIKAVLDERNICVIGNEGKVEANRSMFKAVKNLMK